MTTSWLFRVITLLSIFHCVQAIAGECVLDGWLRAPTVATVRPTGAEPFRVALFESTRVTASLSGGSIELSVREPLAFLADAESLVVRINRRVVAANGQVLLSPGAEVLVTRVDGETVFGDVLTAWAADRYGCDTRLDEIVGPVGVPCDAIGLPDIWEPRGVPYTYAARMGDGTEIRVLPDYSRAELVLHRAPRFAAPTVTLTKSVRQDSEFKVIGKRGSWLHVLRDGPWARITGWVQDSAFAHPRRPHRFIGTASHVCSAHVILDRSDVEYEGPARVKAGTVVEPGAWARVPEDTTFDITIRADRAEVAIDSLRQMKLVPRSVDASFDFYPQWIPAWIPRSAIILPDVSNVPDAAAPERHDH